MILEVTDDTPSRSLALRDVSVGDMVMQTVVFDAIQHAAFACLARDRAPVHVDQTFARQQGFDGPIIQGLAAVARFSRLMGMYLPGENAVLERIEFKYHRPIYANRKLVYCCKVQRILKPLRVVILTLTISSDGADHVSGQSQCLMV